MLDKQCLGKYICNVKQSSMVNTTQELCQNIVGWEQLYVSVNDTSLSDLTAVH